MSLSAEPAGTARIAVVGAETPLGARLRAALAEQRIAGDRVELFAAGEVGGEALLGEYDGEARLIQEPDADAILAHDVIFLCDAGERAREIESRSAAPGVVIDLAGVRANAGAVHPDLNPEAGGPASRYFPIAHPLAMLIAELLEPVDRACGVEEATAVVLRPASDFGEPGVEELREQVVRLLNFSEVPVATFGRQLAFNILGPGLAPGPDGDGDAGRLAGQVAAQLGWDRPRLALRLITAPIFFGHCVQLHLRLAPGADLAALTAALAGSRFAEAPGAEEAATPLEVATESRISVSPPAEDGLGGFWVWAVAGETAARGARQAVRLARNVADL